MATVTATTSTATVARPEHNYSKNETTGGSMSVEDSGQIKMGFIRSYFEGLKSEADDSGEAELQEEDDPNVPQRCWPHRYSTRASTQTIPIAGEGQDPTQILLPVAQQVQTRTKKEPIEEPDELYTVELKTFSTVGEITKPMMVTVLNVSSLTFKCGKCKTPFEKQLSKRTLSTFRHHICTTAPPVKDNSVALQPSKVANVVPVVPKKRVAKVTTGRAVQKKSPRKQPETDTKTSAARPGETVKNILQVLRTRKGRPIRQVVKSEMVDNVSDEEDDVENGGSRDDRGYNEEDAGGGDNAADDNDVDYDAGDDGNDSDGSEGLTLESPKKTVTPEQMSAKDFCIQCYYKLDHRCVKRRKKGEPKEIIRCSLCDKVYKTKISLEQHMRVHTGERPFKCETCEKAFRRSSTLFEHMRIHGGEKRFLCYICGRKFLRKSDQTAHIRRHTNDYKYRCTECEKGFKGKVQLEVHMRKHTGEMPFLCTVCGRKFKHTSGLRTHMRYHEIAENPLRCTECNITYEDLDELRMHTCSAGKQHLCTVCGRTFPQPSGLKHHMRSHTRPNPSVCKSCHETFSNEVELQMHQDENIVKCATCEKTIKEARSCMLNKLPGNALKGKKFKCWSCHSQQKQLQQEAMEIQPVTLQLEYVGADPVKASVN